MINIFAYFRRKNVAFLKNQCYDPIFAKKLLYFEQTPSLPPSLLAKIFFK
jgi:hypothetical protein